MLRAAAALVRAFASYSSIVLWDLFRLHRRRYRVVQAVVLDGERALLTERRTLRGWELPGGSLRSGEDERDALRREVREETGFDVLVEERVGTYERRGVLAHVAVVYRCRVVGGALRTSWETPRVAFFSVEALPETLFPWFRVPLRHALAGARDLERVERLGWRDVWAGMKIDLRTRFQSPAAPSAERDPG